MKTLKLAAGLALGLLFGLMTSPQANATGPWSGCGLGAHAAYVAGELTAGGPVGLGSTGQAIGASVLCDLQMDRVVIGAFADYDHFWGDLKTVGIQNDWTIGARAGLLVTPNTLLYGHAGWSQLDVTGAKFNGWNFGAGTEMRLPTTAPLFVDLRYTHYEFAGVGPGIDAKGDAFRVGMVWKFLPAGVAAAPLK